MDGKENYWLYDVIWWCDVTRAGSFWMYNDSGPRFTFRSSCAITEITKKRCDVNWMVEGGVTRERERESETRMKRKIKEEEQQTAECSPSCTKYEYAKFKQNNEVLMLMKNRMNIQMNEALSKLFMFTIQILHLHCEHTNIKTHNISSLNLMGQTILKMVVRLEVNLLWYVCSKTHSHTHAPTHTYSHSGQIKSIDRTVTTTPI